MESSACDGIDDLKALERRFSEVVSSHRPPDTLVSSQLHQSIELLAQNNKTEQAPALTHATNMEPLASDGIDDLKAFERRFTEVISAYQPQTLRWRLFLAGMSICTAIGAYYWLQDPRISIVPLMDSLLMHPVFTIFLLTLIMLFMMGIHNKVFAPQIIITRMRTVLNNYNMSCDDTGRLVLKPRPNNNLDDTVH